LAAASAGGLAKISIFSKTQKKHKQHHNHNHKNKKSGVACSDFGVGDSARPNIFSSQTRPGNTASSQDQVKLRDERFALEHNLSSKAILSDESGAAIEQYLPVAILDVQDADFNRSKIASYRRVRKAAQNTFDKAKRKVRSEASRQNM